MHQFWFSLIEPILFHLEPNVIVEIGSPSGRTTKNLLEFCRRHGAVLHAIQPSPRFDAAAWRDEYGDRFVFHQAASHAALPAVGPADAILIDGDHNWYTVHRELELIDRLARDHGRDFPLVLLHDVGWPYGRRDAYSDPEAIPPEFRHPFRKQGLLPGFVELRQGGLHGDRNNAVCENDPKNGVLTAVEDFVSERENSLDFFTVPGFHGLGILCSDAIKQQRPELAVLLRRTENGQKALQLHLRALEDERLQLLRQREQLLEKFPPAERGAVADWVVRDAREGRPTSPAVAAPAGRASHHPTAAGRQGVAADIVIGVHDALDDVERCLDSVLRHSEERHRLIVIDDASGPRCRDFLTSMAESHPRIVLLRNERPSGFTKVCNQGMRHSTAAVVVLLNSDTIATPHWLERMLECAFSSPKIGIVGPLTNRGAHQSIPELPYLTEGVRGNPLPPGWSPDQIAEAVAAVSVRAFPRLPMLDGFCFLIKREVIDAIGYLDERAFPQGYGEVFDYGFRATAAGFELAIADHAYVYHAGNRSYDPRRRELVRQASTVELERMYGRVRFQENRALAVTEPTLVAMRDKVGELLRGSPPPRYHPAGGGEPPPPRS